VESLHLLTNKLIQRGHTVAPRGHKTRELLDVTIEMETSTDVLALNSGRKMNIDIAYAEMLQLIGGFSDPAKMVELAPSFKNFLDGGVFHGGYGQRTQGQFTRAIERLKKDPDTRQAIVTIWRAHDDLFFEGKHDYPCTLSLSFRIRDGKLTMKTHMRSNDVWWGWTYDLVQFTQLLNSVANSLNVPVGKYIHYVDSFHLYERDLPTIHEFQTFLSEAGYPRNPDLFGIGRPSMPWEEIEERACNIFYGKSIAQPTPTEQLILERTKEWW
jgi:thymidylate synthase